MQIKILKNCCWFWQFLSGHLQHLKSDHKDNLKCRYKKTIKWRMQGFHFIYQTPCCAQKHIKRLLPSVEGLTEMELITADRRWSSSQPIGAVFLRPCVLLSAAWAVWSNKERKSICAAYCSLPLSGHSDPPATLLCHWTWLYNCQGHSFGKVTKAGHFLWKRSVINALRERK